jgi:hypothetical protein
MSGTAVSGDTLARLRELVAAEGEAIAPALGEDPGEDALAPLVRTAAARRDDPEEYALVIESVLEGYLLHFGRTRLLDTDDADLRLLAGDYLYALGLSRLARLGDLAAVRALADLITLSARHNAAAEQHDDLLAALWLSSALIVASGQSQRHGRVVAAVRDGTGEAAELLDEVARGAAEAGMELLTDHALIAFRAVALGGSQG